MSAISRISRLLTGALSQLDKTNPAYFQVKEVSTTHHHAHLCKHSSLLLPI